MRRRESLLPQLLGKCVPCLGNFGPAADSAHWHFHHPHPADKTVAAVVYCSLDYEVIGLNDALTKVIASFEVVGGLVDSNLILPAGWVPGTAGFDVAVEDVAAEAAVAVAAAADVAGAVERAAQPAVPVAARPEPGALPAASYAVDKFLLAAESADAAGKLLPAAAGGLTSQYADAVVADVVAEFGAVALSGLAVDAAADGVDAGGIALLVRRSGY